MSSVPVQFLIYVTSAPACAQASVFLPLTGCLEVTVGISLSINLSVLNLCNPTVSSIADVIVTSLGDGMTIGSLQQSTTNTSLYYKTLTWIPQTNQVGLQQLCMTAYTK